jgi:hypothetical protein
MLDLEVILEFACCNCADPVGVTVRCTGKAPAPGSGTAVPVTVPCPGCQGINKVLFNPEDGNLLYVAPAEKPRYMLPVPSYN